MGTTLTVTVAATGRDDGFRHIEEAFSSIRNHETVLSTWRQDSELSRLNRSPTGARVKVSPTLAALLREAFRWRDATLGAFNPSIGPLIDAWDLRGSGRVPDAPALARAVSAGDARAFTFVGADTVSRIVEGAWIDAGAFGKGAALRTADSTLRALGIASAVVDFGGQVLTIGSDSTGAPWRIQVADPADRARATVTLSLEDRSAATTAQSERYKTVGGRHVGHVLDPRSGQPVPPWGSVTVVHADPLVADLLATALFVMGPNDGPAWADARDFAALFLMPSSKSSSPTPSLSVRCTRAVHPYIVETDSCPCDMHS